MADVKKFHDIFTPDAINDDLLNKIDRRLQLMYEEYEEVTQAILYLEETRLNLTSSTLSEAMEELAKELGDLLYVTYGTAEELGIPLEEVFKVVHESNMSKVWSDGTVRRNDFGKVLKPDTYSPPDLSFIHESTIQ